MDPFTETVIIANPAAGGGRAAKMLPRIEAAVVRRFGPATLLESDGQTSVMQHVIRALKAGVRRFVVLGGDGTVNEAANGYFAVPEAGRKDSTFLFWPLGTGGDFSRMLGFKGLRAEEILNRATPRCIDAGRVDFVDGRVQHFLNIASLGVSAAVAHGVNLRSKRGGGHLAFVRGTLGTLIGWRNVRARVTIDDHFNQELPVTCLAVANGRFFGSGMMIAPDAVLDDGLFDVVILENMGTRTFLTHARKLYNGQHLSLTGASAHRGKRITVTPLSGPIMLETDGEYPGDAPVEITMKPRAIQILAPWKS